MQADSNKPVASAAQRSVNPKLIATLRDRTDLNKSEIVINLHINRKVDIRTYRENIDGLEIHSFDDSSSLGLGKSAFTNGQTDHRRASVSLYDPRVSFLAIRLGTAAAREVLWCAC